MYQGHDFRWYDQVLEHLLTANIPAFEQDLQTIMEQTVSVHDTSQNPEAFYHGLMIGMTVSLYGNKNYEIKSNREAGYGRYDYLVLCHDPLRPSLVIELKRVAATAAEKADIELLMRKLEATAEEALQQMQQQQYVAEAKQRGKSRIVKLAIAFCGKRFKMLTS
ncbi:hypothetical protein BH10PSE19_BH10PSE19_22000 [soil metagenome]